MVRPHRTVVDEAETTRKRAQLPEFFNGGIKTSTLIKRADRARDAANYDRLVQARPLKPPPFTIPERYVPPGKVDAHKARQRGEGRLPKFGNQ